MEKNVKSLRSWRRLRFALWVACSLPLIAGAAEAQTKRLRFNDDTCDYELRYDSAKLPEAAVKATVELLFSMPPSIDQPFVSINQPEDIAKLDISKVEEQCREKPAAVTGRATLPLRGLDAYKAALVEELDDSCELERAKFAGYRDPSALRRYTPAAACSHFVDAIEGKADLQETYRKMSEASCKDNASPAQCLARWREQGKDPVMMRIGLLDYGWNNCAVQFTKRGNNDRTRARLAAQFLKQYRARKLQCEQP